MKVKQPTKHVHFIYVLSAGNTPFYVGCSMNPGRRLYMHKHFPWGILNGFKFADLPKISINILERVHTDSLKVCAKASARESYWIRRYSKKFDLMNGLNSGIWKTQHARIRYINKLIKNKP